MNTDFLLISPLGDPSRSPGGACGLQLFFEPRQIDFDQLSQLGQHSFEVLRRGVVLRDLRLSRTRDRHALCANNISDAIVDGRRRVDVALPRCGVTTQRAQDLVCASIQRGRLILHTLRQ